MARTTLAPEGGGSVSLVAYWLMKIILSPIFFLVFRVRVEGRDHLPRSGPAVLAADHQSFCDSLFLPLVVSRKVTYLAKAEYFDSKKTAWFFRAVGQIPIRREGGDASRRALETAQCVLADGHLLALYPEGTRSGDAFVHKGRTGVARLALEAAVPVIPVGIEGTEDVQPIGARFLRPFRPVSVRFGAPMRLSAPVDEVSGRGRIDPVALRTFTDDLMHEIARLAHRPYVDEYVVRSGDEPEVAVPDGECDTDLGPRPAGPAPGQPAGPGKRTPMS